MRKFVISCIALLVTIVCYSQTIIPMERDGGVYKISCLVNGAKMKLIFDTGASSVCLSESMAEYLLENDYISKDDFTGSGKSVVADGRIANNMTLVLKDIEIGGLHLSNVDAVVIEGQKAPLLLGLSAINKLGRIEIDGNNLKIMKGNANSDEYIEDLFKKANEYVSDKLYSKACDCYAELYSMGELSDYGKYCYVRCCMYSEDFPTAKKIIDDIRDYNSFEEKDINIYSMLGWVYEYNKRYQDACAYYEKAFDFNIPSNTYDQKAFYAYCIGAINYFNTNNSSEAQKHFRLALRCMELCYNLREGYLFDDCLGKLKRGEKSYRDENVDRYVYYFMQAASASGTYSNSDLLYFMCKLASLGNKYAISDMNKAGIDYRDYLSSMGY